jgi:spermidine synthase
MRYKYGGRVIHTTRDEFGLIEVVEDEFHRTLHFGTDPKQSSMRLDDPASLVLGYTRAMMCALLFNESPGSALLIGLGGGSLARFLLHHFPRCRIDAVECRPQVIDVARSHFRLAHDPRLRVLAGEGSTFMRTAREGRPRYDLILVDAFDDEGMAEEVAGLAFFDACHARLTEDGVLAANLWHDDEGRLSQHLEHLATAFERRSLRLPVPGKGNMVALATRRKITWRELRRLNRPAGALGERYQIEYAMFLRQMRRANRLFRF